MAPPDPPAESTITLVPARFNDRFIAYFLDVAPLAAGYCLTMAYGLDQLGGPRKARAVAWAWIGLYLFCQFLGNLSGGTIGKRLMGLRVVRRDGRALGFFRSLVRALGHLLSTPLFNFGFVLALAHPESRALHDLLAGSVVIEPRRKQPAEAAILFLAAALTLGGLYGTMLYLNLYRPTPHDLAAVEKAREGLVILARIEEAFKQDRGAYTDKLADLSAVSGDPVQFQQAMNELFDPNRFKLQAGNRGYRIEAAARDRRRTRVALAGP